MRIVAPLQVSLVLHFSGIGGEHTLQPRVSDGQAVGVSHVHCTLEESSFLRATVVEKNK